MKGIATTSLPVTGESPRRREFWHVMRRVLGRHAADSWLKLLFWTARRNPRFAARNKPLFMWGTWKYSPVVRSSTLCNARRILGDSASAAERERLARSVVGNFYDFVCDVGRSLGMSRRQLLERIEKIEGRHKYQAVRAEGRGAIVVTAHMGSFEVAMSALLEQEERVNVLFRRDAIGLFERTRSALRKRLGVIEACVDEGLFVWVKLREALAADEVVLIQADRVMPGQKGRRVPFFDGHILMPTGPVKLALASGAPIIPVFSIRRANGGIELFVEDPIRVQDAGTTDAALYEIASVIEKYVRQVPEQWLMIHRAWCEDIETIDEASHV